MEAVAIERENKIYASISTLLIFLLIMLIVLFIKFYTPIPPFPEGSGEQGIEVNFGNTDVGMGEDFSHDVVADNSKKDQSSIQNSSPDDNVITDESSDNTYVKTDKKKDHKKNVKTEQTVEQPQPDKNLQNAFKNFSDSKNSDGDKNKAGNEGNPSGGDAKSYTGDSPTGDGGPGGRGGHGYKIGGLKGRRIHYPPQKISDFSEEGVIVVDIVVDKDGKVTYAEVNRAKSINPNYVLCAKARQSALTTKFNESPDGTLEQKGTITFEFTLK